MAYRSDADGEVSAAVIEMFEDVADESVPSSPVLADVVDPDSLDALFRPTNRSVDRTDGHVTFPFGEYSVTAYASGEVVLSPRDASE